MILSAQGSNSGSRCYQAGWQSPSPHNPLAHHQELPQPGSVWRNGLKLELGVRSQPSMLPFQLPV
jgi:hypothetical protein